MKHTKVIQQVRLYLGIAWWLFWFPFYMIYEGTRGAYYGARYSLEDAYHDWNVVWKAIMKLRHTKHNEDT